MVVISIMVILIALFAGRNFTRARARAMFTACVQNIKTIATANQNFSTENAGHYAATIDLLTPKYVRSIPTCPSAGFATYASGTNYARATNPDNFTVMCGGGYHTSLGKSPNCPQFNCSTGLQAEE